MSPISTFLATVGCILVGITLRWSVAQFPYSGEGKPPKYGDYEAQRHWMEITTQLPIEQWYVEGPNNDLQYWGLDYPPLSAYHSFGLGAFIGSIIPESIALTSSQGFESKEHKFWMRLSVLLSDCLLPSLVLFFFFNSSTNPKGLPHCSSLLLAVMSPPFIMIDYVHFQYNCVSLGLTVLAIICIRYNFMSFTAILFTFAVNHKQMSLYHAVPFFVQMVAVIIFKEKRILQAYRVCLMIASTMVLLWLPFGDTWIHVLQRIFPIKRGVYEDKVGSFWYVLDRVMPLKRSLPDVELTKICAISSILIILPGLMHLFNFVRNKVCKLEIAQKAFLLSLFNVSLILFLFSYHVHEKSIMLAVLPMLLLFSWYPFEAIYFTTISSLSLYPLFLEEGSQIALLSLTLIYVLTAYQIGIFSSIGILKQLIFLGSILGYISLIFGLHFITPPKNLPHLFQSGIAILSFLHYVSFALIFHFEQFKLKNEDKFESIQEKKEN